MKRDLGRLTDREFDVVVIGGGIHGVCVARDAALRGLSVALVERQDFGQATSANSLKIIHGGLRYLQDANLGRVRSMLQERATWLRIAPHLVHALPCLMPTVDQLARSKTAFSVALAIIDLLADGGADREDGRDRLARGRVISRAECLSRLPGLALPGVTGGALWYDAQIYDSERLLIALVRSAVEAGAVVANYVEATGFRMHRGNVSGIFANDAWSQQALAVRGRVVVNCAGAWTDRVLGLLHGPGEAPRFPLSYAVNLVTRQIWPEVAVGLPARMAVEDGAGGVRDHSQVLFVVPWRNYSLIGTVHRPYSGAPEALTVPEDLIESILDAVNHVYPPAELRREDVYRVQAGFLPAKSLPASQAGVRLLREGRVYEHPASGQKGGVMTVVGVKYTSARKVAEQAVDRIVERLGRRAGACQTRRAPVWGGHIDRILDFKTRAISERPPGVAAATMEHLVHSYGAAYEQVLRPVWEQASLAQPVTHSSPVMRAEIVHAVRTEMALTLGDCVFRRTQLAASGDPDLASLQTCAELMEAELGWTSARTRHEVTTVGAALANPGFHVPAIIQPA